MLRLDPHKGEALSNHAQFRRAHRLASRKAVLAYAAEMANCLPKLAEDIRARYGGDWQ